MVVTLILGVIVVGFVVYVMMDMDCDKPLETDDYDDNWDTEQ